MYIYTYTLLYVHIDICAVIPLHGVRPSAWISRSVFWHAGTECAGVALQPIQQLRCAVFGVKHFLYVQCGGMHAISICMMACLRCYADSRGCDVKKGCLLASGVLCKYYSVYQIKSLVPAIDTTIYI